MQLLLEVGGFDMNRDTELTIVNMHTDVQECDIGRGGLPCEVGRIAIVEPFQEGGEGVRPMGLKQEYGMNKPQPKAGLSSSELRKSFSR